MILAEGTEDTCEYKHTLIKQQLAEQLSFRQNGHFTLAAAEGIRHLPERVYEAV